MPHLRPCPPPIPARLEGLLAPTLAFVLAVVLTDHALGLPPLQLDRWVILSQFGPGHIWGFDQISGMLTGRVPLAGSTQQLAFPGGAPLPLLGWAPALLVAAPARGFTGPIGAYNVTLLASLGLAVLSFQAYARRVLGIAPWVAAGAGLAFAFCPFALGALACGQVAKIQHWLIPLWLLALSALVRGRRPWAALLAFGAVTTAVLFTTPTVASFAFLAAGIQVPWDLWRSTREGATQAVPGGGPDPRRWRRLGWAAARSLAAGLMVAAAGLAAMRYFVPGVRTLATKSLAYTVGDRLIVPLPVAQPEDILLGPTHLDAAAVATNHVTYLGLPLLAVLVLSSLGRFRGRGLAWGLTLLGIVLALGPALVSHDAYVLHDGDLIWLPARLLAVLHYPAANSGSYFRAILLASLGLALGLAGVAGRLRRPWGGLVAWGLGSLAVGDAFRATRPLWPRTLSEVQGLPALRTMAIDPHPGAVLDLPISASDTANGWRALSSTVHGRASTAALRATSWKERAYTPVRSWIAASLAEPDPAAARASLASHGLRYALFWRDRTRAPLEPAEPTLDRYLEAWGPPADGGAFVYWTLEPTAPPTP